MSQTIVLLHGWGLNAAVWDSVKPQLEDHFTVHSLNIPGFGGEPWHETYSEIEQVADYLAHSIRNLGTLPVVLVGWSMGGLIATTIALRHPSLIERVHTVASSPLFLKQPETSWPGIESKVLAAFQHQLQADFQLTLKRFLAVQAMGSPSAREDSKQLQKHVLNQPLPAPQALSSGLNWLRHTDLRDQLAELEVPLHRGYGRLDSLVPTEVVEKISHGTATIWNKSAHAPFLNQPEEFVSWLRSPPEFAYHQRMGS